MSEYAAAVMRARALQRLARENLVCSCANAQICSRQYAKGFQYRLAVLRMLRSFVLDSGQRDD